MYLPGALPQRLEELFGIVVQMAADIRDPLEQAFFLMERSCQQYVAVKQNVMPPDIFRLRYRQALGEVIARMVRIDAAATPAQVSAMMPAAVQEEDEAHFIKLVLDEFRALHPGNAVRFGIRPLALAAWQSKHG